MNISWHFFFPGSSTTPWQLDGVIRAMRRDGYRQDLLHACHNRTVVIDAHLGERENKQLSVVKAHGIFQKMTFASRMQPKIYWRPLKEPIAWSLKTVLAPWAYTASVLYHDTFWYPLIAGRRMREALSSEWGRLFQGWESRVTTENRVSSAGRVEPIRTAGLRALQASARILGTCLRKAPEFTSRKRQTARSTRA